MVLKGGASEPVTLNIPDPLPVDIDAQSFSPLVVSGAVTIPTPVPISPVPLPIDLAVQSLSPIVTSITPLPLPIDISAQSFSPLSVTPTGSPPIGNPVGETIVNETNLAVTANTDMFTDQSPIGTSAGDSVIFRILWSADEGGKLSFTLNGTDFVFFNEQNALKEESVHLFDVVVDHGDTFNLHFEKDTTAIFLRVVQLI